MGEIKLSKDIHGATWNCFVQTGKGVVNHDQWYSDLVTQRGEHDVTVEVTTDDVDQILDTVAAARIRNSALQSHGLSLDQLEEIWRKVQKSACGDGR